LYIQSSILDPFLPVFYAERLQGPRKGEIQLLRARNNPAAQMAARVTLRAVNLELARFGYTESW